MAQSTPPNTGIMNWLGNTLASTLGVNPNTPVAQLLQSAQPKAVPAQLAKPPVVAQPAATNTLGPIVNNQGSISPPTTSSTAVPVNTNSNIPPTYNGVDLYDSENTVSENIGQFGRSIWDTLTEWPQVSDTISDVGNSITQDTGQTVSDIVGGFTGNPSTFDPNADPGTKADQRYAQGMLAKQQAIKQQISQQAQLKVEKDKSASDALKASVAMDPSKFLPQLGSEKREKVDKTAWDMLSGWVSGIEWEDMLSGAADSLGELWEDPAIKSALIYYAGSRMMGYSASGSGMAAGEMYVKGVEQQNKIDVVNAKADKDAAIAAKKSTQPDMSKTVQMFDKNTRTVVEGNMAPNGDFYFPGTDKAVNAHKFGLVTYKSGYHKTNDDITQELMDTVQKTTDSTLATITDDNFDFGTEARIAFQDGISGQEMVMSTVRSLQNSGVNMDTPQFKTSLIATMKRAIQKVAKKGPNEDGVIGADLASEVQAMMIKSDIRGEGGVPDFVFSRPKSWDGSKPSGKMEDWEMDSTVISGMMKTVNSLSSAYIRENSDGTYAGNQKARQKSTPTKVIRGLAKIFKEEVMSDPAAATYWRDLSMNDQSSTAFATWFNSTLKGGKPEQKYKGFNNPEIMALTNKIYD